MRIIGSSVVFLGALVACGGDVVVHVNGNTNPDAGDNGDSSVDMPDAPDVPDTSLPPGYPAFTVNAPQVVNTNGGPVLSSPVIVPVFFSNDDTSFTAKLVDFLGKLPGSAYWPPTTKEYGVGIPTIAAAVELTETAPTTITDKQIQTWLATKLGGTSFPAPDANTVYVLYYPAGTTITQGGSSSCASNGFGGYHGAINYGGQNVAYAVLPRCNSFAGQFGVSSTTSTTTHEIIEAATDPYPRQAPGYANVDTDHFVWQQALGGGEVGDLCAQFQGSFYKPIEFGSAYAVQRTWSNAAAKAGHDPCVPVPVPAAYFNAMPVMTDTLSLGGGKFSTKGVQIAVGQSKTIPVELFSDAPTSGPWTVQAYDTTMFQGGTPQLSFTWDKTTGKNGDVLNLTIKVLQAGPNGVEIFYVESDLGFDVTQWIGAVGP